MTELIIRYAEPKAGKADSVVRPMEVMGELVRCKDCKHQHTNCCPMYHEEWYEIDEGDGYVDNDFRVHDYSQDDGFCSWAKMKGGAE